MEKSGAHVRVSKGHGSRTISKVMALTKWHFLICKSLMMVAFIPLSCEKKGKDMRHGSGSINGNQQVTIEGGYCHG